MCVSQERSVSDLFLAFQKGLSIHNKLVTGMSSHLHDAHKLLKGLRVANEREQFGQLCCTCSCKVFVLLVVAQFV